MKLPDLKKPIKMPKLGRGGSGGPSAPSIKPPKFATDLYADLRDRRLLPLVALLLVAIVAAPFLLGGGDDGTELTTPSGAATAGTGSTSEASFSVVPAEPALRDYRRRLGHRQARNPFGEPKASSSSSGSGTSGSGSGGSEGGPSGSGGSEGGTSVGAGSEGGSLGGGSEEPSSGGAQSTETTTAVVVQNQVVSYDIDFESGYKKPLKKRQGVEPMAKIPSKKNPLAVFIGFSGDKKRALFLMTSKVTAYYGKGHCAVDKRSCTLIEVKPGKSETFATGFGDSESRFRLTLNKINRVVQTKKQAASVTKESSGKRETSVQKEAESEAE